MRFECVICGEKLPQFRFFRLKCFSCGAVYKASKNKSAILVPMMYGLLAPLYLFGSFVLQGPLWVHLLLIPLSLLLIGLFLSLWLQRWELQSSANT